MSDSRRQLSDYEGIYVGVALRDPREYSAIAVVGVDVDQVPTSADRYTQWSQKVSYQVVELERFQGKPYSELIKRATLLADAPAFSLIEEVEVVVDVTETGLAVAKTDVNADVESRIVYTPVSLTQEKQVHAAEGLCSVPRKDVISTLMDALAGHRFKIAALPLAQALNQELTRLDLKQDPNDPYDALSVAAGIAVWRSAYLGLTEDVLADGLEFDSMPSDRSEWNVWEA